MARAYEVDASSMCDVLSGVPGVDDVSLEFDSRGNGVLRVRLRPDVDEDAVVGAAVAQLHRRFGVGMEGGRLRLTGPSGRTVVAVVEPHSRPHPRRAPRTTAAAAPGLLPAAPASEPDDVPSPDQVGDTRTSEQSGLDAPSAGGGHSGSLNGHAAHAGHAGPPDAAPDVPGLADEPDTRPVPERRRLDLAVPGVPLRAVVDPVRPDAEALPPSVARRQPESPESETVPEPETTPEPAQVDRLVLDRVEVATGRLELWATVELRAGDVLHSGTASATATGTGAHRAVVGATARAAESALGGRVRVDVEAVDLLGVGADQVGVVVVTLLTERGVDRVSGAALVRGDGRETLVRATLDALNRRTESLQQGRLSPPS